jgi:hypothetical protein
VERNSFQSLSLANSLAQHLSPEEATLGPFDDLLVNIDRRVVHQDRAGLVIDLGIDTRVADEVNNPLLALGMRKTQTGREIPVEKTRQNRTRRLDLIGKGRTYLISIRW